MQAEASTELSVITVYLKVVARMKLIKLISIVVVSSGRNPTLHTTLPVKND